MQNRNSNLINLSKVYVPCNAAVGESANEDVKLCRICKAHGHPHEPIKFRTINNGRLKGDSEYEFRTYQILNYVDDSPHEHKPYRSSKQ